MGSSAAYASTRVKKKKKKKTYRRRKKSRIYTQKKIYARLYVTSRDFAKLPPFGCFTATINKKWFTKVKGRVPITLSLHEFILKYQKKKKKVCSIQLCYV